jgi:hypothetical protein
MLSTSLQVRTLIMNLLLFIVSEPPEPLRAYAQEWVEILEYYLAVIAE